MENPVAQLERSPAGGADLIDEVLHDPDRRLPEDLALALTRSLDVFHAYRPPAYAITLVGQIDRLFPILEAPTDPKKIEEIVEQVRAHKYQNLSHTME